MKLSREDVAKLAGVSATTVSRVVNNRGYISAATRQRVQEAMETLGYYPNELARSLSNNKSNLIGLIFPSLTNPFQMELISHLERILSRQGYKILICNSHHNQEEEKNFLTMLRRHQVEGVIVNSMNENLADYLIPDLNIVSIDRKINETIPVISCDNYAGGYLASQHLISQGCKHILYIGTITSDNKVDMDADKRYQAYKDSIASAGLKPITLDMDFTISYQEKYQLIKQRLQSQHIDGVLADDSSAIAAINAARACKLSLPEQLKVVGFDGAELTLQHMPFLTTIRQPIALIAQNAVSVLTAMIQHEPYQSIIDLPISLYKGEDNV